MKVVMILATLLACWGEHLIGQELARGILPYVQRLPSPADQQFVAVLGAIELIVLAGTIWFFVKLAQRRAP